MSITRRRLPPEQARALALDAARRLLIERGPQAVTLKGVAAQIGHTHGNVLHHFGSAAGLQSELARSIAERVTESISAAVERARAGEADPRDVVDQTFDAFSREGAGALAAWMVLSGNRDALDPVLTSLRKLVAQLGANHDSERVARTTLALVLSALGDSLLGGAVADSLGLPSDSARVDATERLRASLQSDSDQR